MAYASSKQRLTRLSRPATLRLSAPAAPTALYELVDGAWRTMAFTPVAAEQGSSSVIELARPGTFLQAYDPATAPGAAADPPAALDPGSGSTPNVIAFGAPALMLAVILGVLGFTRTWPHPGRRASECTSPD